MAEFVLKDMVKKRGLEDQFVLNTICDCGYKRK